MFSRPTQSNTVVSFADATRRAVVRETRFPCQEAPDLFFAESPALLGRAKDLCSDCPIRQACLTGALERAEPYGVWGGEILSGGRIVVAKRGRGRPRKDAA